MKLDTFNKEVIQYRQNLIAELVKLGANESEIDLISDEMLINAIKNNRKVEDIAWAIMQ